MSLLNAVNRFSDDKMSWPNGIACPFCGSLDDVRERKSISSGTACTDASLTSGGQWSGPCLPARKLGLANSLLRR